MDGEVLHSCKSLTHRDRARLIARWHRCRAGGIRQALPTAGVATPHKACLHNPSRCQRACAPRRSHPSRVSRIGARDNRAEGVVMPQCAAGWELRLRGNVLNEAVARHRVIIQNPDAVIRVEVQVCSGGARVPVRSPVLRALSRERTVDTGVPV